MYSCTALARSIHLNSPVSCESRQRPLSIALVSGNVAERYWWRMSSHVGAFSADDLSVVNWLPVTTATAPGVAAVPVAALAIAIGEPATLPPPPSRDQRDPKYEEHDISINFGTPTCERRFCWGCNAWMTQKRVQKHLVGPTHKAAVAAVAGAVAEEREAAGAEKNAAVAATYKKLRPMIDLSKSVRGKLEKKKVRPLIVSNLSESVRGKLEQIKVRSLVEIPAGVRAKFEKEKAVKKKPIVKKRETASRPKNMGGTRKIIGKKQYRSAPKRLTATNR